MKVVKASVPLAAILAWGTAAALAGAQERGVESIIPALAYGASCTSTIEIRNTGGRPVVADIQAHKSSGALAPLAGHPEATVRLARGERASYKLEIEEETTSAWVKVRERVPSPALAPVLALSAVTECIVADQLRTAHRDVAFPLRNPWFLSDAGRPPGGVLSLVNTSERAAKASACYSAGSLYSLPGDPRPAELKPVCSTAFDVQIPPFGTREFPVEREGSSHFSLKTEGDAIVLEMLRPVEANVKVYMVDSTIKFGGEVPDKR